MAKNETVFTKKPDQQTISVVRSFDASLDDVWQAWTESELLDQWWAPKPYMAVTKKMDFRVGGYWQYAMKGPQGDESWCKESFEVIEPKTLIKNAVNFCDEEANIDENFPTMYWTKNFIERGEETEVSIDIKFATKGDLEKIVEMGFEEGFKMGLNNLGELLKSR